MTTQTSVLPAIVSEIAGEPLRFHVSSRRHGIEPYLVDLEENDGNGWCGCQDFQFHRQPVLDTGQPPGDETRCWHIQQARSHLCDLTIESLSRLNRPVSKPRRAA